MRKNSIVAFYIAVSLSASAANSQITSIDINRDFNTEYKGEYINHIAFPIGGIGTGMFCLEGTGAISRVSLFHHPDMTNEPYIFGAIHVKGVPNGTKVLEGQVPTWKLFETPESGVGGKGKSYGLPRFEDAEFQARFPFAKIQLKDKDIPLDVQILGWSPFIPTDADNSSLPAGALEYQFTNTSQKQLETVFSYNSKNFIDEKGMIRSIKNGFMLGSDETLNGLAIYVDNADAVVDHCWFRGGHYDSQSMSWDNILHGRLVDKKPIKGVSPGASIFVPVTLQPGETAFSL